MQVAEVVRPAVQIALGAFVTAPTKSDGGGTISLSTDPAATAAAAVGTLSSCVVPSLLLSPQLQPLSRPLLLQLPSWWW